MPGAAPNRAEAAWQALNRPSLAQIKRTQQVLQQLTGAYLNLALEPACLKISGEGCSPVQNQFTSSELKPRVTNPAKLVLQDLSSENLQSMNPLESADQLRENEASKASIDANCPAEGFVAQQAATMNPQANLIRELNSLTDPSPAVRKRALAQLRRLMIGGGQTEQLKIGTNTLQSFVESQVLKPLLRRFGDPSSACRELALELTLGLLDERPDAILGLLPYVIPALGERLAHYNADSAGSCADSASFATSPSPSTRSSIEATASSPHKDTTLGANSQHGAVNLEDDDIRKCASGDASEAGSNPITEEKQSNSASVKRLSEASAKRRKIGPVEDVEENRLLLARLLRSILAHSGKAIIAYAADVATMLTSAIADPAPEVAMELCACCESFAAQLGVRLRQVAKPMIGAVTPLLGAKRQKVRFAGLRAIRRLVACGGSEAILDLTGFRDPNLIPIKAFYEADIKTNWFALLALDPTVAVRREFLATLGDWLLHLPERNDHETRLLPYVLSALSDANPSVQSEAFDLMEQIGRLYEREKEAELKDVQFYLPEEKGGEGAIGGLEYSHPFTKRPCLGARLVVRGCFNRLVLPLVAELRAWTAGTKEHAIVLLTTMLTYVEENATQHVQPILLAFLQADEDRGLTEKVHTCCQLLGTFVPPSAYLPVLLPRIQGEIGEADARARVTAAALLSRLLSAASPDGVRSVLPDITSALTEPELLDARSERLVAAMTEVMSVIVSKRAEETAGVTSAVVSKGAGETAGVTSAVVGDGPSEWAEEMVPVLWILLHMAANEKAVRASGEASKASATLEVLARAEGSSDAAALLSAHLDSILALLSPAATWHQQTTDARIFRYLREDVGASCDEGVNQRLAAMEEEARLPPPL